MATQSFFSPLRITLRGQDTVIPTPVFVNLNRVRPSPLPPPPPAALRLHPPPSLQAGDSSAARAADTFEQAKADKAEWLLILGKTTEDTVGGA